MECLYESKRKGGRHEVKFVVARMVDGEGGAASRAEVTTEAGARAEEATGPGAGGGATLSPMRTTQGWRLRAGAPPVR